MAAFAKRSAAPIGRARPEDGLLKEAHHVELWEGPHHARHDGLSQLLKTAQHDEFSARAFPGISTPMLYSNNVEDDSRGSWHVPYPEVPQLCKGSLCVARNLPGLLSPEQSFERTNIPSMSTECGMSSQNGSRRL